MSTALRSYLCVVTFVDARIKLRSVVVKTPGSRSDARRAVRKDIMKLHPDWAIDTITATHRDKVSGPVAAKPTGEIEAARRPKARKAADPAKQEAGLVADATGAPKGTAMWWMAYRAHRAAQKLGVTVEQAEVS